MTGPITSVHNARIKQAVRLRLRRGRNQQGRFLIDGVRELRRALHAGVEFDEVFFCPALCKSAEAQQFVEDVQRSHTRMFEVTPAVFEKLSFGQRREGLVATAITRTKLLTELEVPQIPLIAVLEGVEKPGNLGAVLRTADAAGIDAVILADGATDLHNPNTIRASLGTVFTLPIAVEPSQSVLDWLRQRRIAVFAARVDGELEYHRADFTQSAAIVLGSEAHGLSSAWSGENVTTIRLPMRGASDSLNLSTTAAVLMYEAQRQRRST